LEFVVNTSLAVVSAGSINAFRNRSQRRVNLDHFPVEELTRQEWGQENKLGHLVDDSLGVIAEKLVEGEYKQAPVISLYCCGPPR